jgi:hypothetical protein
MIRTGVTAILAATHRAADGSLHGHTWHVTTWTPAEPLRDAEALQARLDVLLKTWKASELPPALATGEAIAAAVAQLLGDCDRVLVERPGERISAEWTR